MTTTEFVCVIDGAPLERDHYASARDAYEHYRCPRCREGGVRNPETDRRIGPVFEGRTPGARISSEQPGVAETGVFEL